MKAKCALAALFLAAACLTPAHAITTLTYVSSFSPGDPNYICLSVSAMTCTGSGAGATTSSITAAGYLGMFMGDTQDSGPNVSGAIAASLGVAGGKLELGSGYMTPSDGIVLDFANATPNGYSITSVAFKLFDQHAGAFYEVWGMPTVNGAGSGTQIGSGPTVSGSQTVTITAAENPAYSSYDIGLTNGDCDLALAGITVNYNGVGTQSAPEPGTFVMGGMALLAIGVTVKKRRKQIQVAGMPGPGRVRPNCAPGKH